MIKKLIVLAIALTAPLSVFGAECGRLYDSAGLTMLNGKYVFTEDFLSANEKADLELQIAILTQSKETVCVEGVGSVAAEREGTPEIRIRSIYRQVYGVPRGKERIGD